mmetsp:Transcript_6256/g.6855  ORF Transcript_6256/g.6855 Transcript_6256/m.6855 type:complete len:167 (-) Transcript_6256:319-819(-)
MKNPSKITPINPLHQGLNLENNTPDTNTIIERNFPEDAFLSEEKKRRSTSALTVVDDHRDSLREDELEERINHLLKVRDFQNRSIRSTIKKNLKTGKGRNHNFRHNALGGSNNVLYYFQAGSRRLNSFIGNISSWFAHHKKREQQEAELQGPLIDEHVSEAENESD